MSLEMCVVVLNVDESIMILFIKHTKRVKSDLSICVIVLLSIFLVSFQLSPCAGAEASKDQILEGSTN